MISVGLVNDENQLEYIIDEGSVEQFDRFSSGNSSVQKHVGLRLQVLKF